MPRALSFPTQDGRGAPVTPGSALGTGVGAITFTIKRQASKQAKTLERWGIIMEHTQVSQALASRWRCLAVVTRGCGESHRVLTCPGLPLRGPQCQPQWGRHTASCPGPSPVKCSSVCALSWVLPCLFGVSTGAKRLAGGESAPGNSSQSLRNLRCQLAGHWV